MKKRLTDTHGIRASFLMNCFYLTTHHSKRVKSTAYLVENGSNRVLYTGDLIWIDAKYHGLLQNIDLVITEGSYLRRGGLIRKDKETGILYGHNGIPNLLQLLRRFTSNVLLVHFGAWFYQDIKKSRLNLRKLGKQLNLNILIGYDGMEYSIPERLKANLDARAGN